ncbi:MAG TPA: hypothetical protein VK203_06040 [Nostocaceae cyanobacterium]|nr:hypothetical protein [Nostocaceae cyanobacterium]
MKNNIECLQPEDIKIDSGSKLSRKFRFDNSGEFWQFFYEMWQNFLVKLMADPYELQVKEKIDRYGNQYWQAYDPLTGNSFTSGSEREVSMWIEQLYRQR